MPKHPCEDGLSAACFKAYPRWAKQAVAYKLVHLLVPKPLSTRLPVPFNKALIGPGAVIPPGVVFPPGMVIPPGFTWKDSWTAWLNLIFEGKDLPWTLFPKDWKTGDPLPPGVELPPGIEIPTDLNPSDPPPPFYIPGYSPVPVPPTTGPTPPIYVTPFEPRPPSPIGGRIPAPSNVPIIVFTQNDHTWWVEVGINSDLFYWALPLDAPVHAKITSIDILVGKMNNPTDNLNLEFWEAEEYGQPIAIVDGGEATPVAGSSIPDWFPTPEKTTFQFPDKPEMYADKYYAIILYRSGAANGTHYYRAGIGSESYQPNWYSSDKINWNPSLEIHGVYDIWGIEV